MRILVLIYEFPPVGGGGGQAAKDTCQALVHRGHEVRVLTAHMKGLARHEMVDGIQVMRIPSGRRQPFKAGFAEMSGFVLAGIWNSRRVLTNWSPDIVHVHFAVPTGPVAWMLHYLTRIPYVVTIHLGDVPGGVPEKTQQWFRWVYPFTPSIYRNAAQVIAVSNYTRSLAEKHYPVDIQVIPNGVDLEKLDPGKITVGNPPRLVFAGRFMAQKNLVQLVKICATLKDLPWTYTMIGDGPLRPEVETEIHKHGLKERFTLPGWVSTEEVIKWFAQSDILFMPSLSEGLPVAGVQGIAMGLSIVASRIGGFFDLVEHGRNGYLIDVDKPECFSQKLRKLLSNLDQLQTFRERSRQIARRFDINLVAETYEDLFKTIVNEG